MGYPLPPDDKALHAMPTAVAFACSRAFGYQLGCSSFSVVYDTVKYTNFWFSMSKARNVFTGHRILQFRGTANASKE